MELLKRAYAYNRRANEVVTEQLRQLTPEQRAAGPAGITMSPNGFYAHLALVEWAFLGIVKGGDVLGERIADDAPFDEVAPRLAEVDAGWEAFIGSADAATYATEQLVPWFGKALRVEDAALQCLMHSHQHRTDLRWALYHYGIETPDADYIVHAMGLDIALGPPGDE